MSSTTTGPAGPPGGLRRARRWARRFTAGTTAGGVLLLGAPAAHEYVDPADAAGDSVQTVDASTLTLTSGHPRKHRWRGHPGRRIRHYTVRRGDTATGLAVRFHAWTRELIELNHLSRHARLLVGERIRIPVVVAAARRAHRHPPRTHPRAHHRTHARPHPRAHRPKAHPAGHRTRHVWRHADASRATVRRVVVRTARRHGVNPDLALAIAWQESGWQQRRVSSAGAVGVMQVMPSTGRWLSGQVGHRLFLRRLHHNVTAGVVLIKMLRSQVGGARWTMAGYYQGLGSVRSHGLHESTRRYLANVASIRRALARGWDPA